MKQTAVEWLVKEMVATDWWYLSQSMKEDIIKQAKAMEKEQIVTTWNTAHQAGRFEGKGIAEENWLTFESYWKETLKSE